MLQLLSSHTFYQSRLIYHATPIATTKPSQFIQVINHHYAIISFIYDRWQSSEYTIIKFSKRSCISVYIQLFVYHFEQSPKRNFTVSYLELIEHCTYINIHVELVFRPMHVSVPRQDLRHLNLKMVFYQNKELIIKIKWSYDCVIFII